MDEITSFAFFTHLLSQLLFLLSIYREQGEEDQEKRG